MIILDTHVLIWLVEGRDELGPNARRVADKGAKADQLGVSAISFWEIAMLQHRGRLHIAQPLNTWRLQVLQLGVLEIPVTGEIGIAAAAIPEFHPDPADRIITATATLHRATLMTADDRILSWPGSLRRQDGRV